MGFIAMARRAGMMPANTPDKTNMINDKMAMLKLMFGFRNTVSDDGVLPMAAEMSSMMEMPTNMPRMPDSPVRNTDSVMTVAMMLIGGLQWRA